MLLLFLLVYSVALLVYLNEAPFTVKKIQHFIMPLILLIYYATYSTPRKIEWRFLMGNGDVCLGEWRGIGVVELFQLVPLYHIHWWRILLSFRKLPRLLSYSPPIQSGWRFVRSYHRNLFPQ